MNCKQFDLRRTRFYDEELEPLEMKEMRRHVDGCPACRRSAGRLHALSGILRQQEVPAPPEGLTSRLLEKAQNEMDGNPPGLKPRWGAITGRGWGLAAAALLFFAAGALLGLRTAGSIQTAQTDPDRGNPPSWAEVYADPFRPVPPGSPGAGYVSFLSEGRK